MCARKRDYNMNFILKKKSNTLNLKYGNENVKSYLPNLSNTSKKVANRKF